MSKLRSVNDYTYQDVIDYNGRDLIEFQFTYSKGYYFDGNYYTKIRNVRLARARKLGTHSKQDWIEMLCFFNHRCVKCGRKIINHFDIHKDHIVPLFMGGSNSLSNIQPLCYKCNLTKKNTLDYRVSFCKKNNIKMKSKYLQK